LLTLFKIHQLKKKTDLCDHLNISAIIDNSIEDLSVKETNDHPDVNKIMELKDTLKICGFSPFAPQPTPDDVFFTKDEFIGWTRVPFEHSLQETLILQFYFNSAHTLSIFLDNINFIVEGGMSLLKKIVVASVLGMKRGMDRGSYIKITNEVFSFDTFFFFS